MTAQVRGRNGARLAEIPSEFSPYEVPLRVAYVTELLQLEARSGVTVTQAMDDALRGYFDARLRDMMWGYHGT